MWCSRKVGLGRCWAEGGERRGGCLGKRGGEEAVAVCRMAGGAAGRESPLGGEEQGAGSVGVKPGSGGQNSAPSQRQLDQGPLPSVWQAVRCSWPLLLCSDLARQVCLASWAWLPVRPGGQMGALLPGWVSPRHPGNQRNCLWRETWCFLQPGYRPEDAQGSGAQQEP